MRKFALSAAVKAVGGRYFGPEEKLNASVASVSTDSRNIGQGTLFFAFTGARVDGHDFMADCLRRGAVCCVSEREPKDESEMPCIVVDSTLTAIGALASFYRGLFDIPVIGITGSVGKTTTKEMIAAVLSRRFRTHKTQKNFNNELGVPRTLLSMPEDTEVAVVEMGISGFGEMTRLTRMVRPTAAVFTVIGDSHLEFLGDRAGVLRAKTEIFDSMNPETGLAVFNGDDAYLRGFDSPVKTVYYGRGAGNDLTAGEAENLPGGGMRLQIQYADGSFTATVSAFGNHLIYAMLAAAAVGKALGMTDAEIAAGIADYETVGNRARLIDAGKFTILSDCYNANPNSVASAVDSLMTLPGRKVCILGDMLELGENSAELHRRTGEYAAKAGVDLVIGCGKISKHTAEGAGEKALWFAEKAELMQKLPELIQPGDCVLVKASHSMAFEDFVDALQKL